jgi:hydroxypyruvate isomerase
MPRYAANLTMFWAEVEDPYERFRLAADAGFGAVERVWVYDLDVPKTKAVLDELGLELVLFDPYPGDWAKGERGLLCVPGREAEILDSVKQAVEHAQILGTKLSNLLAGVVGGVVGEDGDRDRAYATARTNLELVLDSVDLGDLTLLLESVCDSMWNGSFLADVDIAARLVREIDDPRLRLQFDAWHVAKAGLDPHEALERHFDITRHIQVADNPGRHEPGTGELDLFTLLDRIDELGYSGHVGLEYVPKPSTEASLEWLPRDARA